MKNYMTENEELLEKLIVPQNPPVVKNTPKECVELNINSKLRVKLNDRAIATNANIQFGGKISLITLNQLIKHLKIFKSSILKKTN